MLKELLERSIKRREMKRRARSLHESFVVGEGRGWFGFYHAGKRAHIDAEFGFWREYQWIVYPMMNGMKWDDTSEPLSADDVNHARRLLNQYLKGKRVKWSDPDDIVP